MQFNAYPVQMSSQVSSVGRVLDLWLQGRRFNPHSHWDLVQLANKISECEGRPNCGTQVHAPMAAALYVPQRIEIVQEWTGPMTTVKV